MSFRRCMQNGPLPADGCPNPGNNNISANGKIVIQFTATATTTGTKEWTTTAYSNPSYSPALTLGSSQPTVTVCSPLSITCPGNQNANTSGDGTGNCLTVVNYPAPTTGGGCGTVTVNCSPASGSSFAKGTTTVNCTATDSLGQMDSCSFAVTVNDNENPTIVCVLDQNRNTATGVCTYTAVGTEFNPTSFGDNCTGATISYSLSGATSGTGTTLAGKVFNKGTTTVTWSVTDTSLNTAMCSFDVVVSDNQNPQNGSGLDDNR